MAEFTHIKVTGQGPEPPGSAPRGMNWPGVSAQSRGQIYFVAIDLLVLPSRLLKYAR